MKRWPVLVVSAVLAGGAAAPSSDARQPPPPPFYHCYIGSFGPRDNPIAVFKRDDEIVNARVGAIIDGCTLQQIHVNWVTLVTPAGRDFTVSLEWPEPCSRTPTSPAATARRT